MLYLLAYITLYIVETVPIYVIANKSGHEYAWLAFVPIAQFWLLCDMADLEWWFIIVWLVPYVDILFWGFLYWRIAENTNKPGWVGLFMLIPVVNLFVGYYIAFVDTGNLIT